MLITLLVLLLYRFVSSSAAVAQPPQADGFIKSRPPLDGTTERVGGVVERDTQNGEEELEDPDFDDYSEGLINAFDLEQKNINSLMHLHQDRGGEILVPCFGLWWPVGRPTYDYYEVEEESSDDDDRKKKRRRAKRQRKAARTKKKRS